MYPKAPVMMTPAGAIFYFFMILILIGGFSAQYLLPETYFGQLVGTGYGRLGYLAVVVVVTALIEMVFKRIGIDFTRQLGETDA